MAPWTQLIGVSVLGFSGQYVPSEPFRKTSRYSVLQLKVSPVQYVCSCPSSTAVCCVHGCVLGGCRQRGAAAGNGQGRHGRGALHSTDSAECDPPAELQPTNHDIVTGSGPLERGGGASPPQLLSRPVLARDVSHKTRGSQSAAKDSAKDVLTCRGGAGRLPPAARSAAGFFLVPQPAHAPSTIDGYSAGAGPAGTGDTRVGDGLQFVMSGWVKKKSSSLTAIKVCLRV